MPGTVTTGGERRAGDASHCEHRYEDTFHDRVPYSDRIPDRPHLVAKAGSERPRSMKLEPVINGMTIRAERPPMTTANAFVPVVFSQRRRTSAQSAVYRPAYKIRLDGAGEGNRTLVCSLGSRREARDFQGLACVFFGYSLIFPGRLEAVCLMHVAPWYHSVAPWYHSGWIILGDKLLALVHGLRSVAVEKAAHRHGSSS